MISNHDLDWNGIFLEEAGNIKSKFGSLVFFIDHVGSTSVKDLPGKPIVDILISVQDWTVAAKVAAGLASLNYHVSEICEDTPRFFLTKYPHDSSIGFHVHICEPGRKWAQDMLVFKTELSGNKELACDYVKLKYTLAEMHWDDIDAYSRGKKSFIESAIPRPEEKFSVNLLLTHQAAELERADTFRLLMIGVQFSITILAGLSVFKSDDISLLVIALGGFLLLGAWLWLSQLQQKYKVSGDQARRTALLMSGLNKVPSKEQWQKIINGFNVSIAGKPLSREEDQFASREFPSYKRLAELIEESAFWMSDLQHASAKIMSVVLWVVLLFVFSLSVAAIISATHEWLIVTYRVLLALLAFFISTDVLGLLFSYKDTASAIDDIFRRVEMSILRDYPESDLLLLVSDYNATIERAPSPLPRLIKFRFAGLSQRWHAHRSMKYLGVNSNKDYL
jgi:GrpB-like predicted nucleotidyltransferase (UPF0157 family)